MSRVDFHPEARRELQAAILLHEHARPGYGARFLKAVEAKVEQASRLPGSGSLVEGIGDRDIRRYSIEGFSYTLVVALVADVPTVLAVAHDRRRPGYWRRRLR